MRVQRVLLPGTRVESWTVLDDGGVPVEPVGRWLAYLSDVDRSPDTVKALSASCSTAYWLDGRRGRR